MVKTGPIKPDEVIPEKSKHFPQEIFQVVNCLIVQNFTGKSSCIRQDAVVSEIASMLDISTSEVYAKGYLNFEDSYIEQGWEVEYDSPGYNETWFQPTWTFRIKD